MHEYRFCYPWGEVSAGVYTDIKSRALILQLECYPQGWIERRWVETTPWVKVSPMDL